MRAERLVDLGDDVLGVLAERLVDFEVDEVGGVVGDVLVAGGRIDLAHALIVCRQVCCGAKDPLAKPEQLRAPEREIDGHDVPFCAEPSWVSRNVGPEMIVAGHPTPC